MNTTVEIPRIKKIGEEHFWVRGSQYRAVTKVFFRDGTAITFSQKFTRKEAVFNGYYQKCRDLGMTVEEAALFAGKGQVEPLKQNQ
jgi:hypothetical protein